MAAVHRAPRRDSSGSVLPHDHPGILDGHFVIRHIHPQDVKELGRVPSGVYTASSGPHGGMSVDIGDWMVADGLEPLHYLRNASEGATRLPVGALRRLGYQVGWDPLPENPHHGEVWGNFNGSKRKRAVAALAQTLRKAEGEK